MSGNNHTCHWCRKSKNRIQSTLIIYIPCSLCRKTFCERCINMYPDIKPSDKGCLSCQKLCCCNLDKCTKYHKCCYNSKRSLKRSLKRRTINEPLTAIPIDIPIDIPIKKRKIENSTISELIEIVEAEFEKEKNKIYIPIPIRLIPILSRNRYPVIKQKKHVTWNL